MVSIQPRRLKMLLNSWPQFLGKKLKLYFLQRNYFFSLLVVIELETNSSVQVFRNLFFLSESKLASAAVAQLVKSPELRSHQGKRINSNDMILIPNRGIGGRKKS